VPVVGKGRTQAECPGDGVYRRRQGAIGQAPGAPVHPIAGAAECRGRRVEPCAWFLSARETLAAGWAFGSLAQRTPHILAGWAGDVPLLHREMISTLYTLEGLTRRPRVVDVDDAIHLFRAGAAAKRLAARAGLVIVGNDWLAEAWRRWSPTVEVLSTAVDTSSYKCQAAVGASRNRLDRLDWKFALSRRHRPGTGRNRPSISGGVDRGLQRPASRPAWATPRYVPRSIAAEDDFVASVTVGLMPLDDGPWELGKCSFKMLQYMAAGRPSVMSSVGMNRDNSGAGGSRAGGGSPRRMGCGVIKPAERAARDGGAWGSRSRSHLLALHPDRLAPRLAQLLRGLAISSQSRPQRFAARHRENPPGRRAGDRGRARIE